MSSAKIIENPEVPGELVGSGTNASLPLDSFRRFAITCACVCDTTEHKNVGVTEKNEVKKNRLPAVTRLFVEYFVGPPDVQVGRSTSVVRI